MPVLHVTSLLDRLANHTGTNPPFAHGTTNATENSLKVVCAWPVSGQYGPGSRVLYYVLVATCVFARREKWLRGACLAAALLFPAVAAIHGIVLAAVHVNAAVDMDVYGSFQLCGIGILTAPVTVTLSTTYFESRGRNIIFLWTGLILAGLLSLTVEFYRTNASPCRHSGSEMPLSYTTIDALNSDNIKCGLTCSTQLGPFSPLRRGSANNIYIIPAPDQLSLSEATLLAAACCIPAILSLLQVWIKIYKARSKTSSANEGNDKCHHCSCAQYAPVGRIASGKAGKLGTLSKLVRTCLSHVQMIVLCGAVLTIVTIGEKNFFSLQVRYQTEPMASIGQWAPIVGTGLAILGSLYLLLAAEIEVVKETKSSEADAPDSRAGRMTEGDIVSSPLQSPIDSRSPFRVVSEQRMATSHVDSRPDASHVLRNPSVEISCASCGHYHKQEHLSRKPGTGIRGRVAKFILLIGGYLDRDSDPEPPHEEPAAVIHVPGEKHRNRNLSVADGGPRSRTPSVSRKAVTEQHAEDISNTIRTGSPRPQPSPRSPSQSSRAAAPRGSAINNVPATETSFNQQNPASPSPPGASTNRRRSTQDSLHPRMAHNYSGTLFAAKRTSEDGQAEEIENISASAGIP